MTKTVSSEEVEDVQPTSQTVKRLRFDLANHYMWIKPIWRLGKPQFKKKMLNALPQRWCGNKHVLNIIH